MIEEHNGSVEFNTNPASGTSTVSQNDEWILVSAQRNVVRE